MSTSIRFYVSQKDINEGCRYEARGCPLARAITRKTGTVAAVGVASATVNYTVYRLSPAAKDFRRTFDGGGRDSLSPRRFSMKLAPGY